MLQIKLLTGCMLVILPALAVGETPNIHPVVVTGERNPQEFDLKGIKLGLSKFHAIEPAGRDKIRLAYYVYGRPMPDLSSLSLALVEGQTSTDLIVLPGGRIDLPLSVTEMPDSTVLVSNAPKRSFRVIYKIDVLPGNNGPIDLAYLRSALAQAQNAWKKAYGLAGLLVPKFNCLEFQFGTNQSVIVNGSSRALWTGSGEQVKVPIATREWPDSAVVRFDPTQLIRIATCKE